MSCPFTNDALCAWVQGEEKDAVSQRIRQHVEACAMCHAVVTEMRLLLEDVRSVEPLAHALPERIGRYRIVRKLGSGGMGVVYEAEQEEPRRRVAVKVIRGADSSDELKRRMFARELVVLSRLNHPHIAMVYDAGRTERGEPYFVMELVDGVDLLTYANHPRRISLRDRIALMILIARAVSHAHERGIVHRDLKPGNILVASAANGSGPMPKILDFGLARILEPDAAGGAMTRPGVLLGTLNYMSPEQARGDPDAIDIRSDVYSLGVILYELITGTLPLELPASSLARALERIESQAPRDPREWNTRLPRDVAIIALKCLEKQPERRYRNAAVLALDLERFITGHPILARPAGFLYKLKRFVARHVVAVVLASLLAVAIGIGTVSAMIQATRIAAERDRAQAEAVKVARLNSVLENLWQSVDPWKAGDREARVIDVLRSIAQRIEQEMADTPLLAAAVRNTLGNTWRSLGTSDDYKESERHLRFSLVTRLERLGQRHLETARSQNDLAETLYWMGDYEGAQVLLASAIETRRALLERDHPDLAESLNNLGSVLKQQGELDAASRCYREALELRERIYQRKLADGGSDRRERAASGEALAETRNNRGALLRALAADAQKAGDARRASLLLNEALREYQRALELRRVWLGDAHPSTATSHNNLGRALQDAGRFAEAEKEFEESLRILRRGLGSRHQLVARALHNLARLKLEIGDREEALAYARSAHAMRAELLGSEHSETLDSAELVRIVREQAIP
jgi:tetratricopeptide (TPR) repeat protein